MTDVQYDPENREKKKEYEKLHDLQDEMCDSYYFFEVPERGEPVGEMPQFDIPEGMHILREPLLCMMERNML